MLNAIILLVFVEAAGAATKTIECTFPGKTLDQKPIRIALEPHPSLKDRPGLFRVMLEVDGGLWLKAQAQPVPGTDERDIIVRGVSQNDTTVTIGLLDNGIAALSIRPAQSDAQAPRQSVRTGECHGFESHIDRWLPL